MKKCIFDLNQMEDFIKHFVSEMENEGYSAWFTAKVLVFVLRSIDFDIE